MWSVSCALTGFGIEANFKLSLGFLSELLIFLPFLGLCWLKSFPGFGHAGKNEIVSRNGWDAAACRRDKQIPGGGCHMFLVAL